MFRHDGGLHRHLASLANDQHRHPSFSLGPTLAANVVTEDIESFASELEMACAKVSQRLPIRCAGLLEVSEEVIVTFIHRSAQEFLVNTLEGQRIRQADQVPSETRLFNLVIGMLGCIRLEIECEGKSASPELSAPMLELCQHLGPGSVMADVILSHGHEAFVVERRLSPDSLNEYLRLAQAIYSVWGRNSGNGLVQPDFLGAIAWAGFFDQSLHGLPSTQSGTGYGPEIVRHMQFHLHVQPQDHQNPAGWTAIDATKANIDQLCPRDWVKGRLLMASIRGRGNQGWGHTTGSISIDKAFQVGKHHHRRR